MNDGGPAFPCESGYRIGAGERIPIFKSGMSLRDYIAAKAFAVMLDHWLTLPDIVTNPTFEEMSRRSIEYADRWIKVREEMLSAVEKEGAK